MKHWLTNLSADYTTAVRWTGGVVPSTSDDVALDATGAAYTVTSSGSNTVNTLTSALNATLAITGGTFTATNGGASAGQISIGDTSRFAMGGTLNNAGAITVNSAGNYTDFFAATASTLTGGGTLTLGDRSANRIYGASAATTLTNVNNTISGGGSLGFGQLTLINQSGGIINATAVNNQLILNTGASIVTNAGLIEATGGGAGLLIQSTTVNSANGMISGRYSAIPAKPCRIPASPSGKARRRIGIAGAALCMPATPQWPRK